jgi:hypothetical protein
LFGLNLEVAVRTFAMLPEPVLAAMPPKPMGIGHHL